MKRSCRYVISITMALIMITITASSALAGSTFDYRAALEPYQVVIDEVNAQYGSSVSIQEDNIEEVYNNLIKLTPAEFKESLVADLLDLNAFLEGEQVIYEEQCLKPERIRKRLKLQVGARQVAIMAIYPLKTGVETAPSPMYVKFVSYSYRTYTDRTHFRPSSISCDFSNSNQNLDTVFEGMYYTGSGLALTAIRWKYITFYVDGSGPDIV